MAVSQEIVMNIKANIDQALSALKKLNEQFKAMGGPSGNTGGAFTQQMKSIQNYYKAMGTTQGMVKEQMKATESMIRRLMDKGVNPMNKGVQKLVTNYKEYEKQVTSSAKANDSMVSSFMKTSMVVGALYKGIALLKQSMGEGFEFNNMIEATQMAFSVMLKSSSAADDLLNKLKNLQTTTGIGIQEGAEGAKQMLAYGFGVEGMVDNLKMLKTVAGAVNVPLKDIVYVYGTLRSQGRAYTRDLMQFAMRGIPIYEALSKTMGKNIKEIKKLTEDGKIGFEQVEKAMKSLTGTGGVFAGMLEKRLRTTVGMLEQLGFEYTRVMGVMMAPSDDPMKTFLTDLKDALTELAPTFKSIGESIAGVMESLGPGIVSTFKALTKIFAGLLNAVEAIAKPLGFLLDIVGKLAEVLSGPLAGGITALGVGMGGNAIGGVIGGMVPKIGSAVGGAGEQSLGQRLGDRGGGAARSWARVDRR